MEPKVTAAQRMALNALVPHAHFEASAYESLDREGNPPSPADAAIGAQLRRIANWMHALATRGTESALARFFGEGPG